MLRPYRPDSKLEAPKRTELDRLYQQVVDDLQTPLCRRAEGRMTPERNENKIPVNFHITV